MITKKLSEAQWAQFNAALPREAVRHEDSPLYDLNVTCNGRTYALVLLYESLTVTAIYATEDKLCEDGSEKKRLFTDSTLLTALLNLFLFQCRVDTRA